tara:strand:- start:1497 stop:2402 length:906 start_codon:yes stop_codon:yes gene_type:complete
MSNQPADTMPGQNNMAGGTDGSYYNNQMQGAAATAVSPYSADFGGGGQTFFAPGIDVAGVGPGGQTFFNTPQGNMFAQSQGMVEQAYSPQAVQAQRDLMLQSARQANLQGLQSTQGQLAQMGLGTLGGQAGALSGQYAQGAMNEQQAMIQGQQMAQMAAQGAMQAQSQMQVMQMQVGDAISQAYGTAYDVVTATAPRGYKINEALESDLANFANLLGAQVMSGEMSVAQAQMALATYPDQWAQKTGLSKYRRHDMGSLKSPESAFVSEKNKGTTYDPTAAGEPLDSGTYYTVSSQSGTVES